MSTLDGAIYKIIIDGRNMELSPEEYDKIPNKNNISSMYYTNRNTWGFYLNQVPYVKSLCDKWIGKRSMSAEEVLDGILNASNRREQLAILSLVSYVWNGDQGNGAFPDDDSIFDGTDF